MFRLICGSIFDIKCDLIIIPCNNFGMVSPSIRLNMLQNSLPLFEKEMNPGEIYFKDNIGDFTYASQIGFAASVNQLELVCREEYLHSIAKQIRLYCEENFLHIVNIPLLGTGAGKISPQKSFNILKSYFESIPSITLNIFVFSNDTYNKLKIEAKKNTNIIKNPRVFISYTSKDPDNKNWVKQLVSKLRSNGVDACIDMYDLKPGEDLPQWMTNQLIMADKVLLICDKYYAIKADSRTGGVGWETMIIQGDMLSHTKSNKYICIVRDNDIDKCLPIYVKSKYSLSCTSSDIPDEMFSALLHTLFDCNIKPPLGPIPNEIINSMNAVQGD